MMLKLRTELFQREPLRIVHKDHAVRIAHRDAGHRVFLVGDCDGLRHNALRVEACHGDTLPLEHGNAHVHSDRRHRTILHNDARHHRPRQRLDGELFLRHVSLFVEPARKTADAVSAHLRLRPIGVELAHPHIRRLRGARRHQAVRTDAEMTVAHLACKDSEVHRFMIEKIHDHEIIAAALPFAEFHKVPFIVV